jgi:hypothetical protein
MKAGSSIKPQKAQVKDKGLEAKCWDLGLESWYFEIFVQRTGATSKNELWDGLANFSQGAKALLLKKGGGYFDYVPSLQPTFYSQFNNCVGLIISSID